MKAINSVKDINSMKDKNNVEWSLYKRDQTKLESLKWNGGSQYKSVNEILKEFLKDKNNNNQVKSNDEEQKDNTKQRKIQYLSTCGSGKSAVILNVMKEFNRGIVVVPSLNLQRQYFDDYNVNGRLYILKNNGNKLKIGTMFGRKNFMCRFMKDAVSRGESVIGSLIIYDKLKITCAQRGLPCNRILMKGESRIGVGCECKYFVPPPRIKEDIKEWEEKRKIEKFKSVIGSNEIKYYKGVDGNEYGLFIKKDLVNVCEYYKQFYNYLEEYADIIIMNKYKFEIETNFGRKPLVDIECIDESDEFLNGLNESVDISNYMIDGLYKVKDVKKFKDEYDLILLQESKNNLMLKFKEVCDVLRNVKDNNKGEASNKNEISKDFGLVEHLNDFISNLYEMKREKDINIDETNNLNEILYKIGILKKYLNKAVVTITEGVRSVSVRYSIPYPDLILGDLLSECCNNVLFVSATTFSDYVMKSLFGLEFNKTIYGRLDQPGSLYIMKPKAFEMLNVTYTHWQDEDFKQYYNNLLKYIVVKLNDKGNTLVLTPAKKYVNDLVGYLKEINANLVIDFSGEEFKNENVNKKGNKITVSQRQKRGVDLRDDLGRVIIWSKYPLVDISDGYIKSLFGRFGSGTWKILNDIAELDVIQGVCRGLRSNEDYCYFSTPDQKVYDIVNRWWNEQLVTKLKVK